MAQNFVQDGVTLTATVVHDTKIYAGTPIYLASGGATAATATSGIDGIAMNTCAHTEDANVYVYDECVYRTEGVFSFKSEASTTFVLGDSAYIVSVDNSTAAGSLANDDIGARTVVTNLAGCSSTEPAIGTVVGLGSIKALGTAYAAGGYVQVKIVTRANSNLITHS